MDDVLRVENGQIDIKALWNLTPETRKLPVGSITTIKCSYDVARGGSVLLLSSRIILVS